jgi:hypothetical protein
MKKQILMLLSIVFITQLFSVALLNISPQTYNFNRACDLRVEVQQGLSDIAKMKVCYRIGKAEHWYSEEMKQDNPGAIYFSASIPVQYLTTETIEYYFCAELNQGNKEYFPPQNETAPNYFLEPDIASGEAEPGFVLLTDNPIISAAEGYLLVVSFFALSEGIDPASIEVWVGGKDVTASANISSPLIVYKDENPQSGNKKAVIRAKKDGKTIHSPVWSTEVLPSSKTLKQFTYQGTVNFASNYYNYSDEDALGYTKSDAATWTDFYGSYGIYSMQANLYLSSLEHSNSQPVNRYTIGFNIPHLDFFAGDYAPTFSQLTLNGKNMKGIYSRLYYKALSLSVTHGQTVRKTKNELDLDSEVEGMQKSGTFKQEAFGTRLQIGYEEPFFIGFSFTRHNDVISSLDSTYYQYTKADSIGNKSIIYTTKAQENAVLGMDARINIPAQKAVLGAEIATSLLNTNTIPGAISQQDLEDYTGEDIPVDPQDFSDLFVFNKNMIPFLPCRESIAWLIYYRNYFRNNMFGIQYSETGSAFNAFGASYQMPDSRVISLTDNFNVSRYFILSGGLNLIEDNLSEHKSETNNTTSWYLQSILRLTNLPYFKLAYYNNLSENKQNKNIASTFQKAKNSSQNIIFGIGYNITQIPYVPTQLDISYKTGTDNSKKSNEELSDNKNSGFNLTMFNRLQMIPLTLQFTMSLNNNKDPLAITNKKGKNNNFFMGASYSLWEDNIKPYTNFQIVTADGAQGDRTYQYYTLGVEAYPWKALCINTNIALANYKNKENSVYNYNNFVWRVLLSQRF